MHVRGSLHVVQYPLLQVWHGTERVWDVLILLDVPDNFGGLCSFSEVDKLRVLDHRRNAVLDER